MGTGNLRFFKNTKECARALDKTGGNILLTTGSKELKEIASEIKDTDRLYVRVLPSVESLKLCEEAGILKDHIIAMHGPFDVFMNRALIKQYKITVLVTKESGAAGGFSQKTEAAEAENIACFCISRPVDETGISVQKAARLITGKSRVRINIIGIGMGSPEGMSIEAAGALGESDIVFGAERLTQNLGDIPCTPAYLAKDIIPVIDEGIDSLGTVSILFSGDIGFYSGAKNIISALNEWAEKNSIELTLKCFPGISSVSYLSAKTGIPYSAAKVVSLHGKNTGADYARAVDIINSNEYTYILLSGGKDISELAKRLIVSAPKCSIVVADKLSYPDECITEIKLNEALGYNKTGLITLLVKNPFPKRKKLIPYRKDEEFARDKTPMTKEVIRHESVRQLGLHKNSILYDIGSGTGSVSIEAAGLSPEIKVYSIEKNDNAVNIETVNTELLGVENITIIKGEAPECLEGLERPDAVFIGGSGKKLKDILQALKEKAASDAIRVVINAVSLETISELTTLKNYPGVQNLELEQINVSVPKSAGEYNLMQAQNPVMIAAFDLFGDINEG